MSIDDTQKFMINDRRLQAAQQFRTGQRRAPLPTGRGTLWPVAVIGLLVLALLLAAGVLFTRTVQATAVTPGPLGQGGGRPAAVGNWLPRVSDRVIEVVDRIPGSRWDVAGAARWLDDYTLSRMRTVTKCSGKAYRCVVVRAGKVKGASVGWAQGSVITIDTRKAATRSEYRRASVRKWLLVHELAHTYGLKHSGGKHLMNPTPGPGRLVTTAVQRRYLSAR